MGSGLRDMSERVERFGRSLSFNKFNFEPVIRDRLWKDVRNFFAKFFIVSPSFQRMWYWVRPDFEPLLNSNLKKPTLLQMIQKYGRWRILTRLNWFYYRDPSNQADDWSRTFVLSTKARLFIPFWNRLPLLSSSCSCLCRSYFSKFLTTPNDPWLYGP